MERSQKLPHLHPMMVHFPQGLFPVAFASFALYLLTGLPDFETGAYTAALFGLILIPTCVVTGFVDWKLRYKGAMTKVFKIKIAGSFILLAFAIPAVLIRCTHPHLMAGAVQGLGLLYAALLAACLATCVVLGYYGGRLVFH